MLLELLLEVKPERVVYSILRTEIFFQVVAAATVLFKFAIGACLIIM